MMDTQEIIKALRRMAVETGGLNCLGCGHEHGCGVHGCAVLRAAADALERKGGGEGIEAGKALRADKGQGAPAPDERGNFLLRRFLRVE